ncbi:MAG: helix-turn-helix domain-containing protein [Actinomycetota bacterium]
MNQQTIGQRLSGARRSIRASVYQASQDTKIRVDFLESMEQDDFDFVSGGLYVRGMLRSYSRWLGLDETAVMSEFDAFYAPEPEPSVTAIVSRPASGGFRPSRPHWLIASFGAAAILLILSLVGLMNPGGNVATAPSPELADVQPNSGAAAPNTFAQAPAPPMEGVNVAANVTGEKVWVRVHIDGDETRPAFQGTLVNGQSMTFTGQNRVKILIGDLGGLGLSLNGKDLGVQGQPGEVATREFTLESVDLAGG